MKHTGDMPAKSKIEPPALRWGIIRDSMYLPNGRFAALMTMPDRSELENQFVLQYQSTESSWNPLSWFSSDHVELMIHSPEEMKVLDNNNFVIVPRINRQGNYQDSLRFFRLGSNNTCVRPKLNGVLPGHVAGGEKYPGSFFIDGGYTGTRFEDQPWQLYQLDFLPDSIMFNPMKNTILDRSYTPIGMVGKGVMLFIDYRFPGAYTLVNLDKGFRVNCNLLESEEAKKDGGYQRSKRIVCCPGHIKIITENSQLRRYDLPMPLLMYEEEYAAALSEHRAVTKFPGAISNLVASYAALFPSADAKVSISMDVFLNQMIEAKGKPLTPEDESYLQYLKDAVQHFLTLSRAGNGDRRCFEETVQKFDKLHQDDKAAILKRIAEDENRLHPGAGPRPGR